MRWVCAGPVTGEELLLLLRGGWNAGEGDLRDPRYRALLQGGVEEGVELDRNLNENWPYDEDPIRDVMLPEDEHELRMAGEKLMQELGASPEVLLSEAYRRARGR